MLAYRKVFFLLALVLMWLPAVGSSESMNQCGVCGKAVTQSSNWFIIARTNGEEDTYDCAGCGLSVLAGLAKNEVAGAKAEDFLRRVLIDAENAYYLRGSEVGFCCEPYWLAFASREEAEKFARGFGGKVLDFEQALERAPEDHPHGHDH